MQNLETEVITSSDYVGKYATQFITILVDYSPRLISALLILFIGLYVVRFIDKMIRKVMIKRNLDPTLSKFLADIMFWVLRILLFVSVIDKLGIGTSSFVAILGAAGLAIGLSLQGSLSNFAGGMLIILFKPFRLGDFIEAQGVSGTVSKIQIFVTKLTTTNNQTIFVPNGALSNGNIINYSLEGTRRADINFTVSYDSNLQEVKSILKNVIDNDPRILKEPAAAIVVTGLVDNGVTIAVRPWANRSDFWDVHSDVLEVSKSKLYEAGIEIQPFVKEASIKPLQ